MFNSWKRGRTFISNFFDIISINKLTDTENYLSVCDIEDIPMLPIKTITSVHEGFDIHYH
jgi:hypothetical protein